MVSEPVIGVSRICRKDTIRKDVRSKVVDERDNERSDTSI